MSGEGGLALRAAALPPRVVFAFALRLVLRTGVVGLTIHYFSFCAVVLIIWGFLGKLRIRGHCIVPTVIPRPIWL